MSHHRESPVKSHGKRGVRWIARYTNSDGKRVSAGTFDRKGPCRDKSAHGDCCAQHAIDAAYHRPIDTGTVGKFAATWTERHPRAKRTNDTNAHRVSRVLDVKVSGRPLRDWPYRALKRRHVLELVDAMLVQQGRSASGAVNILRALSAMSEDAITDEVADVNAFKGVRVRGNDPRITKQPATHVVYSFEEMHALAAAAGAHEPAIRVLSDCGLRIGELLGLERRDYRDGMLHLRGSAHEGVFTEGDQPTKRHVRSVPVPPTLAAMLGELPARLDTRVLFPTPGGFIWRESNWRRTVWNPARDAAGLAGATPHGLRHSWITHLRAAGVDPADLAAMSGHSVATATAVYTHALNRSYDDARKAVG